MAAAVTGVATAGPRAHAAKTTLTVKADPGGDLKFTKGKLSARAGKVKIVMKNPASSGTEHGIAIGKKHGKIVAPGERTSVTKRLKPGKYSYYCPVPGHRAAGMKGTLTVR
jgi:uncharacterized cupredoxin-like copper-binding protein